MKSQRKIEYKYKINVFIFSVYKGFTSLGTVLKKKKYGPKAEIILINPFYNLVILFSKGSFKSVYKTFITIW